MSAGTGDDAATTDEAFMLQDGQHVGTITDATAWHSAKSGDRAILIGVRTDAGASGQARLLFTSDRYPQFARRGTNILSVLAVILKAHGRSTGTVPTELARVLPGTRFLGTWRNGYLDIADADPQDAKAVQAVAAFWREQSAASAWPPSKDPPAEGPDIWEVWI